MCILYKHNNMLLWQNWLCAPWIKFRLLKNLAPICPSLTTAINKEYFCNTFFPGK